MISCTAAEFIEIFKELGFIYPYYIKLATYIVSKMIVEERYALNQVKH